MKLPEELRETFTGALYIDGRPVMVQDAERLEAIVRDCAKVCFDAHKTEHPTDVGIAILSRYHLEPTK